MSNSSLQENIEYEQKQHAKRMEENSSLYKTMLKFIAGGVSAGMVK